MISIKKTLFFFIYFFVSILLISEERGFLRFNPLKKHFVVESEHLRVVFPEGLSKEALFLLKEGEIYYERMRRLFLWAPSKITVTLYSNIDYSNGFATITPYNLIGIINSPPPSYSELSGNSLWLKLVISHELAHIFHLSQSRGIASVFKKILGNAPLSLVFPNAGSTPLFIEGIAVYKESVLTGSGRLNSSDYKSYIKREIIFSINPPKDRMYNFINVFPGPKAPYLYGSFMIDEIVKRYGWDKIKESLIFNSRLPLPFSGEFYLGFSKKSFSKDIYYSFRKRIEREIKSRDFGERLTNHNYYINFIRKKGDKLYFLKSSPSGMDSIVEFDISDKKEKKLFSFYSINWISLAEEGIYFSAVNIENRFYERSAIYFYSFKEKKIKKVLKGSSFYPEPIGDGKLFFIKRVKNKFILFIFDGKKEIKLSDEWFYSADSPNFDGEGRVYFVGKRENFWDIYYFDIEKMKLYRLTHDSIIERYPQFINGKLFFISAGKNSQWITFFDIRKEKFFKLKDIPTGSKGFFYDGGALFLSVIDDRGVNIYRSFPLIEDSKEEMKSDFKEKECAYNKEEQRIKFNVKKYNPYRFLIPKFWLPNLEIQSDRFYIGALTQAISPYGEKSLFLSLLLDSQSPDDFKFDIYYSDYGKKLPVYFNFRKRINFYGQIKEEKYSFFSGLSYFFGDYYRRKSLEVGIFSDSYFYSDKSKLVLNGFYTSFTFLTTKKYPLSISKEDGVFLKLFYEKSFKNIKSDYSISKLYIFSRAYLPLFIKNQVLALRADCFLSWGDEAKFLEYIGGAGDNDYFGGEKLNFSLQRGFLKGEFSGFRIFNGSIEIRTPFRTIERGLSFLPFYLSRLYFNVFTDISFVRNGKNILKPLSYGVELAFHGKYGYYINVHSGVGIAFNNMRKNDFKIYFYIGERF